MIICTLIVIANYCFHRLSIIGCDIFPLVICTDFFFFHWRFALSCIGDKPPQVFVLGVARFKSPNQIFFKMDTFSAQCKGLFTRGMITIKITITVTIIASIPLYNNI